MADLDLVMTAAAPSEAPPIDAGPQIRDHGAPEPDDAVQRDRQPGDVGVLRLYRDAGCRCRSRSSASASTDATVLRAAHAYEQATPWRERRPNL